MNSVFNLQKSTQLERAYKIIMYDCRLEKYVCRSDQYTSYNIYKIGRLQLA